MGLPAAHAMRSVRSTTRISSSRLVAPWRTRRAPSSARGLKPWPHAAARISRAVARRATISARAASTLRISRVVERPVDLEDLEDRLPPAKTLVVAQLATDCAVERCGLGGRHAEQPALPGVRVIGLPAGAA